MAWYAATGTIAAIGFAALSVATGICAAKGWHAAIRRQFDQHRRWMLRCFVLLCSAVVLRVIGGLADVLGTEWTYPIAAWSSWFVPLVLLESLRYIRVNSQSAVDPIPIQDVGGTSVACDVP
jgi:uncharacterized membrane protein YozB (DUF420 family)